MRKTAILFWALILVFGLAACGQAPVAVDPDPDDPGDDPAEDVDQTFIIALETDIVQFDPVQIQDATTSSVAYQIYERLLDRDHDGSYMPQLAESYEVDETGITWTFRLRQGVTFTDGSAFDAHVAKWHFERAMGEESRYQAPFSIIDEIEVVDDHTIVFHLTEPSAPFIDNTIMSNAGYIASQKAYEEKGDDFAHEPVGTGPFMWHAWTPGTRVELVANPNWWGDGPKLDKLVYRVIPEASTQVIELETGGVHLITRGSQEDLERLEANPDFSTMISPAYRIRKFEMNVTREPFDDIRVRKAINYALDMPMIVEAIAAPLVQYADSVVPLESWGYPGPGVLKDYPFDPDRALELLEEAGKPQLSFDLNSPDGRYFMDKEISEASQHQLQEVGIDTSINVKEWGAFIDEVFASEFDMIYLGWNQSSPEPSLFTDALVGTGGRGNFAGYSDSRIDDLLAEAMATPHMEERKPFYVEVQKLVNENAWYVHIGNEALVWITPTSVSGFTPSPAKGNDYTQLYLTR